MLFLRHNINEQQTTTTNILHFFISIIIFIILAKKKGEEEVAFKRDLFHFRINKRRKIVYLFCFYKLTNRIIQHLSLDASQVYIFHKPPMSQTEQYTVLMTLITFMKLLPGKHTRKTTFFQSKCGFKIKN